MLRSKPLPSLKTITSDFLIIGGGIIGLSIGRCLKKIFPDTKVILLEKEYTCGLHASGRNSGVLHAGFYYTPDSLKAKFTKVGNQQLTAYCEEKKIPLNRCGKLVVAKNEKDLSTMDELLQRGKENGVVLYDLTETEAQTIEPRVITYQRALFSPHTFSVNPTQVIMSLQKDAENEGVQIHCNVKYLKKLSNNIFLTTMRRYEAGYVINAAGLYADQIANNFNFAKNYRILPFKGIYLYSNEPQHSIRTHIYPVPDLKNPFLGVHFTVTVDGKVKIGPTAIPALWREQYNLINHFNISELIDILSRQIKLFVSSEFDFKKLAVEEMKKCSKFYLLQLAATLAKKIEKKNFTKFGPPGIRAQLLNLKEKKLEMDFIVEGDKNSFHILNAVSPGFTSALPFAQYVCAKIAKLLA